MFFLIPTEAPTMDRREYLTIMAGATTVGLAGCIGGDGDGSETTTESTTTTDGTMTTTTSGGDVTIGVRSTNEHGKILVGPNGMSLYLFEKDTKGSGTSTCQGKCADAWPPLTVSGKPTKGENVTASLSTFKRKDGSTQVAVNGWPLYYYVDDNQPGDTKGQDIEGFGAEWYLLQPNGTKVEEEAGGEASPTSSSGF